MACAVNSKQNTSGPPRPSRGRHHHQEMTMRIQKLLLFFWLFLFLATATVRAQTTTIEQEKVATSRALAGHADIGITKVPAEDITVDLCSSDWKTVLASTKTDANGYFSLEKPKTGDLFYIRLSASGVNPFQLRVRVKKHGPRELKIHLSNAT